MEIASVYEQALKYKKDRHPSDKSLSNPCGCGWLWWAARVEPLAQFEWFSVRMVFGVPKCLDSKAIESANPFTQLMMIYCTNDVSTKYLDKCGQKKGQTEIHIRMWTNYDARLKFGIYPFLLESPEPYVQQIFVLWKIRSSPKYIFLCTLTHFIGLWAKMWFEDWKFFQSFGKDS